MSLFTANAKFARVLPTLYAMVAAPVVVITLYLVNFTNTTAELLGVPLVLVAIPWSLKFYEYRPHVFQMEANDAIFAECIFIIVNMIILFLFGLALDKITKNK